MAAMAQKMRSKQSGFTIVELIIAIAMTMIVILGIAVVLVGSQRAYQVTYDKVYADVVTDAFVARRLFESVIRKSSNSSVTLGDDGEYAETQYYNNDSSSYLDRYARFYTLDTDLKVEYGSINEQGQELTIDVDTVCGNVSLCVFNNNGSSIRMLLELDDGDKTNTVVTSAFTHN